MAVMLGTKAGMTRLFGENGRSMAVTVIDVSGNRICQLRTPERDGYAAVQLARGSRRNSLNTRADIGHMSRHKSGSARRLSEYRVAAEDLAGYTSGTPLAADAFGEGQIVDVVSRSRGCGFAGVIKRYNFKSGRASHGASRAHRKAGATGQCQDPGRVFRGKKMAGHMGARKATALNLKVVRVDAERNLLFVRGSVPGAPRAEVTVRHAVKKPQPAASAGEKQ